MHTQSIHLIGRSDSVPCVPDLKTFLTGWRVKRNRGAKGTGTLYGTSVLSVDSRYKSRSRNSSGPCAIRRTQYSPQSKYILQPGLHRPSDQLLKPTQNLSELYPCSLSCILSSRIPFSKHTLQAKSTTAYTTQRNVFQPPRYGRAARLPCASQHRHRGDRNLCRSLALPAGDEIHPDTEPGGNDKRQESAAVFSPSVVELRRCFRAEYVFITAGNSHMEEPRLTV